MKILLALAIAVPITAAIAQTNEPTKSQVEEMCSSIPDLKQKVDASTTLHNLRQIASGFLLSIIEFYQANAGESEISWDAAYLIDGPEGTGALVMSTHGDACAILILPARVYKAIVSSVEQTQK